MFCQALTYNPVALYRNTNRYSTSRMLTKSGQPLIVKRRAKVKQIGTIKVQVELVARTSKGARDTIQKP